MLCFIDVFRRLVMSSKHNLASRLLAVFALATLSLATVAQAQPYGPGRGGPGYMMGPGMMDRQLFGRMCSPRMAGFAEWRLDRMEQVIKPVWSKYWSEASISSIANLIALITVPVPHRRPG
jgi:hypothetical protein